MNDQDFFKLLIGDPPPEVEFEIELKCREINDLPAPLLKKHCFDLVKHTRTQDLLLMAAISRISDTEAKLFRAEQTIKEYRKIKKMSIINKICFVLFGKSTKK